MMAYSDESYSFGMTWRNYFSSFYLCSSIYNRDEAKKIEDAHLRKPKLVVKHRFFVLNSIISAVSFSEAFINEFFKDIVDGELHNYPSISEDVRNEFKKEWDLCEKSQHSTSRKFQSALSFLKKPKFKFENQPYQDFALLIMLRNYLMHYKPETIGFGSENELAEKLKNKFKENKLWIGSNNSYFPDTLLGFGCANWSVKIAKEMCDEFCKRINYIPHYQQADWIEIKT
jgi:hypothetical protein